MIPYARPVNFGPKVVFGKLLPKLKLYTKFKIASFSSYRNK